jgi:hypothetical protein
VCFNWKKHIIFLQVQMAQENQLYYSLNRVQNEVKELPLISVDNILRSFKGDWNNSKDQFKPGRMAVHGIDEDITSL